MDQARPATAEASPPPAASGGGGWLWLLLGSALLPFTIVQTMIPLAAWLAPIVLLRFSRLTRSGWIALPAIAAAEIVGGARLSFAPPDGPTIKTATVTIDRTLFGATVAPPFDWLSFNRADDATRAAARPRLETGVAQLLARTETSLKAGAKLVGWQETAARVLEEDRQSTIDRAAALVARYGAHIQIALGVFTRAPKLPYYLNQSILIDDKGQIVWSYDKAKPVVPGEAIVTPLGRISTAICNDFHFPSLIRQVGRARADIVMAP